MAVSAELFHLFFRDGRVAQLENVYIRGSKIRFLILPDMLKNAPMFKRQGAKAASSAAASGRGKSAILRAQGKQLKKIGQVHSVLPEKEYHSFVITCKSY